MTLAEFFINIGIKGGASVDRGLENVGKGLDKIKSGSLEAKAAVLAVVYALEQITSAAADQGQALRAYENITGDSAQRLQDWSYAGQQAKITSEEMTQHFKKLWDVISTFEAGHGAPEGSSLLGIDLQNIKTATQLMDQLHMAAQKLDPNRARYYMKNFGIDDKMFDLFKRQKEIKAAPNKNSENEIKALDQLSLMRERLKYNIGQDLSHMVAKHGQSGIQELTEAYNGFKMVAGEVDHLVKSMGDFKLLLLGLTPIVAAVFGPIPVATAAIMALLAEYAKHKEGKENLIDKAAGFGTLGGKSSPTVKAMGAGAAIMPPGMKFLMDLFSPSAQPGMGPMTQDKAMAEKMKQIMLGKGTGNDSAYRMMTEGKGGAAKQTININQYGVDHPKDTEEATRKALSDVRRQMPDEE